MARQTTIEWTGRTWNWLRGCWCVSPGCLNCYACGISARFSGEGLPFEGLAKMTKAGPRWSGEIRIVEDALELPLRWRKPQLIFVNSMSDTFHKDVPFQFIEQMFAVMTLRGNLSFTGLCSLIS